MRKTVFVILAAVVSLSMVLAACAPVATPTPEPTQPPAEATKAPEPTATPVPPKPTEAPKEAELGTKERPLVMLFVPSGDTEAILSGAKELDALIEKETGLVTESSVATSYAAAIEAMCAGKADIAWLATFAYVLANDKCDAQVLLITVRYGKPTYRGQIIYNKVKNPDLKDIKDLKGKRFAFTDPASTSGYLYPSALFKKNGIDPEKDLVAVFAGSHNAAVLAVYKGQVDAGATYDDARRTIAKQFPDVNDKVGVLAYTDEIPNDTVSVRKDLPEDIKTKLSEGLLKIAETEEGKKVLGDIYNIGGLAPGNDEAFNPVRETATLMGVDLEKAIQPKEEKELDEISKVDPTGQEIVFWHVSTKKHYDILTALINEFNETNKWGITVKEEYAGYYGDIFKKIQAAIAAGEPPDLAVAYQNQTAVYAKAGAVVPLDDYVSSEKYGLSGVDLLDIFPSFLEADRLPEFDGKLMSFPPARSSELMYYNIDWLKKLGYDGPPETWDEFKEMCLKATDPAAGTAGYAINPSASTFAGWVWSRGGEIISEDGKTALFNNEQAVEALTFLQELIDAGAAYQIAERYGDQTDFANQKVLFTFGSTAGLPYYKAAIEKSDAPFEWSVAPFPHSTPDPVVDVYGPSWTVFKTTPEKQLAAWLFIRWFTQPENTAKWAMVANYFPVRQSSIDLPEMKEYLEANPVYAKAFGFLKYGKVEPGVSGWSEVRGIISDAIVAVINGADPKATLDAAVEEANAVLAGE